MTARAYRVRAPKERRFQTEPWQGMDDTVSAFPNALGYAQYAGNCVVYDIDRPAPTYVGIPGFVELGSTALGGVGARTWQALGGFTKLNGTSYRIGICGGKFYTFNWGTNTWTETLSAANLSGAAVTLSATATVSLLPFANEIIVSDGVNTPWSWDGTSGGGITKLTNAPVIRGPMWAYYGQWFGVKDSAPNTIVWSEVGLLNTGFEAGGYNNAWDMRQTSSEAVVAGAATNDYIVIFRENSITLIRGEVTSNFSSTGTREAVGEGTGTKSPYAVLVHDTDVYFLASDTRIMRVRNGQLEDVSAGLRTTLAAMSRTQLAIAQAVTRDFEGQGERVVVWFAQTGGTTLQAGAYINPMTGRAEGVQTGFQAQRIGTFKDSDGFSVMVHGGGASATTSADGYSYAHGLPAGTAWNYELHDADVSIAHTVIGPKFGYDVAFAHRWWRGDASFITTTSLSGLGISLTTPSGTETFATAASLTVAGATYGSALYGTATYGGASGERHLEAFRPSSQGRWGQITVAHATLGEQFRLEQLALTGIPQDARAAIY